jgi:type IV pilus assembly protein PilB
LRFAGAPCKAQARGPARAAPRSGRGYGKGPDGGTSGEAIRGTDVAFQQAGSPREPVPETPPGRARVSHDIGEKLVAASLITERALEQARLQLKTSGGALTAHLVRMGAISEQALLDFLSHHYRVPSVDLARTELDGAVVRLLPAEMATKFMAVPLTRTGRRLTVAMAQPTNLFALDDIKFVTGLEVEPVVATEGAIKKTLDEFFDSAGTLADVMKGIEEEFEVVEAQDDEDADVLSGAEDAPIVKLVNSLIADAVRKGASDIHMEPYEKTLRVRFRIDGTLYEMMAPPYKFKAAITSRIKIMAELDIAERRVPQDGRIKIKVVNRTVDLRVSTLPTVYGEKIVMRILDKSNLNIDLEKLGFEPRAMQDFVKAIASPYGMVLVTGPTGSGKTTTLYSALTRINTPEVNVMTAEDPVEYNLDGINQVPINDAVGLSFAAALKAFLRQDPNIIMVGEIRDIETGSIATKAALTGHLVLSTLHTNDAASAIGRLIDMGLEPFLVASSVNLVLAQRLVRRPCANCRRPIEKHPEILRELNLTAKEAQEYEIVEGPGCIECNNTGYKGRQGVYEVMPLSPAIRDMVLERAPSPVIKRKAIEEGMLTLRMDGLAKLKRGVTTVEEVLKETAAD